MKIRGILFITLLVLVPVEEVSSVILKDERNNTSQQKVLGSKELPNSLLDDDSNSFSLKISEEVRYKHTRGLSLKTYWVPAFGGSYLGDIHASDVTLDSIFNGDAEDDDLERWTDMEYHGEGDSAEPELLDSDNDWDYEPEDGDFCYFFDVDSSQIRWVVDYYADISVPEDDTELSFSFSNAWESNFVSQSNVDLHITFDFDGFDVTFFLYAKSPAPYTFNTTSGGKHHLHFLVNSSWGTGWHDIGPIDISKALLQQNMYTKSSLPSYLTLNELRVEALAYNSYKLHLLVDNLSLETELDPDDVELTVNEKEFDNDLCSVEGDVQEEVNDGEIGFKIGSMRYDDAKYELDGELEFDIRFREDLDSTVDYYYIDDTNIGWVVNCTVFDSPSDKLDLYKLRIYVPPEWSAISLIDGKGNELIDHTKIEQRAAELYIRLKEPYVRSGAYSLKAHGPNYVIDLRTLDSTNHTRGLPLNITLLRPLEQNMTIQLEKLPNAEVVLTQIIPVNSDFVSIAIKLNETLKRGNYRLIAKISSQFRAGIRTHHFSLISDWGVIKILSKNTVNSFDEYCLVVQCLDYYNASIIENATVSYSWDMGNGITTYNRSNKTYVAIFRANATPGAYPLVLSAFAEGYEFAPKNMTLKILDSDFILDLIISDNITAGDSSNMTIILKNSKDQPVEGIPILVYLNGTNIVEAVTSEKGTLISPISVPLLPSFPSKSEVNITVIALWNGQVLSSTSKSVQILNRPSITEETTSVETMVPVENGSENSNDKSNEYSLLIYAMMGLFPVVLGTGFLFRRRGRPKQGSTAHESTIEIVPDGIEEGDFPRVEIKSESAQPNSSPLAGISWQLRGIQSVDDFARELNISPKEVVQLIKDRNTRVSKEERWRIVAGGQLIIPPDPTKHPTSN